MQYCVYLRDFHFDLPVKIFITYQQSFSMDVKAVVISECNCENAQNS